MTRRHLGLNAGASLLVITLAACGAALSADPQAAPPRPPAPLPSGATALTLATAPPEADILQHWACPGNTITPVQVVHDGYRVIFVDQLTGQPHDLVWPRGFSARLVDGRAEVVAPDGTVVLREGDIFSDVISGVPNICEVDGVYYPPAS